jgi:hypothetical protein
VARSAYGWPLGLLQFLFYVVQENLEALSDGERLPGLAAVTAQWMVLPVNLAVALGLAMAATFVARRVRARCQLVERVEALLERITMQLARRVIQRRQPPGLASPPTPIVLGSHLWRRPPPLAPDC